jgi:cytochrome P450
METGTADQRRFAMSAAIDFDPFAAHYLADPYPVLARLRSDAPVFFAPALDMWVLTRAADIEAVFTDPRAYSAAIAQDPLFPPAEAARDVLRTRGFDPPRTMSNLDPPEHRRIRTRNMRAFSARRIAELEPRVRQAAREMVEVMLARPAFDLVAELSFPLPAYMIFTLIGFPPRDTTMLKNWCGDRLAFSWGRPSAAKQVEIAANMGRYWHYCQEFVARKMAEPGGDFTSQLLAAHHADPAGLSVREIAGIVYGLSIAGHETTTNLTTNAVRQLLAHRAQWEALCADPALIPDAVEEALRFDTSVLSWRRVTTRPDRFDVTRKRAARHISFGHGIHFCLGAPLARMELRIVLELLTRLAPDLDLLQNLELSFEPNLAFRGPRELWLRRT